MLNSISSQLSLIGTDPEGNRLFEFTPQTLLTSDFRLKLRPGCGRMLRVELMSPPRACVPGKVDCGGERQAEKIGLLLNGSALGEAELRQEGTWGVYSFELPCGERLEGSAISFSLPENVSVFLRQRRVED